VLLWAAAAADPLLRARAIDVLGDIGLEAAAAIPALLAALGDHNDEPRRKAAEALGTVAQGARGGGEVGAALASLLALDESAEVRRNAALSLARLAGGPALRGSAVEVAALSGGMADANLFVRGFCVLALRRVGTVAALGAALERMEVMRHDNWHEVE
jgi:HEAT repeat protein